MECFLLSLEADYEGKTPVAIFSNYDAAKAKCDSLNSAISGRTSRWVLDAFVLDGLSPADLVGMIP